MQEQASNENLNHQDGSVEMLNDPKPDTKDPKTLSKLQYMRVLEVVGLAVVIVIVTGLLTLPIVFYLKPDEMVNENVRKDTHSYLRTYTQPCRLILCKVVRKLHGHRQDTFFS